MEVEVFTLRDKIYPFQQEHSALTFWSRKSTGTKFQKYLIFYALSPTESAKYLIYF